MGIDSEDIRVYEHKDGGTFGVAYGGAWAPGRYDSAAAAALMVYADVNKKGPRRLKLPTEFEHRD